MGSVLPLVGIVVLMVFGFVVAITALSYDPRAKFDRPRDRASARERRPQWTRLRRGAQRALSAGREAARELAVAAGELAVTLLTGDSVRPRVVAAPALPRSPCAASMANARIDDRTGDCCHCGFCRRGVAHRHALIGGRGRALARRRVRARRAAAAGCGGMSRGAVGDVLAGASADEAQTAPVPARVAGGVPRSGGGGRVATESRGRVAA
jgi:hypothetical protein